MRLLTAWICPRRHLAAWVCGLWLAVACVPALAQSSKPVNSYFREVWTTRDGLPHNQVHAIAQTPDGYLWFATWEGLVRYNGLEFEVFNRKTVPQLRDNGVRSIAVARDGALVIGTSRGGVSVLREGAWVTYGKPEGLAQNEIMSAFQDGLGRLWVATESAGITRLDGDAARQFRLEDGLQSNAMYAIVQDAQGVVWAGSTDGLVRIEADRVTPLGEPEGLPQGSVFALLPSGDGGIYAGTEHGVYYGIDGHFSQLDAAIPDDAAISLQFDERGDLWIGTVNHGLLRYGSHGVESLGSQRGLPNNRVAALFLDREGSLWAGTNGGLLRLRDAPFTTVNSEHGLSDDYVRTVLAARDGRIWIGTSRGLNRWDGQHATPFTIADGLPGDSILSLLESHDSTLWVGTYASGLLRLRNGRVETFLTRANGLPSNQIRALAETADGSLWIGTTRGLMRWLDGELTRFGLEDGLPREFILSLYTAKDGALWVGTANGAARISGGVISTIDIHALDEAQDVFGFHESAGGEIWMTSDRGLLRWQQGRLSQVGLAQGLPVDALFQVVEDDDGYFWLSSNRGIFRVARRDVEAASDDPAKLLQVESFGEADGMASAQCNGGSGPAAMRAPDGTLWFATAKGAAQMRPSRLTLFRRTPPPVVIETVRVDDAVVRGTGLVLPAGSRKLEIHYAGLSYQLPRQIRYRYQLEGFDPDWVERGTQRVAQYTNLPPGDYVFRVSAANPGAAWQPNEARLTFHLKPHWWQLRWVQGLAVLLALLAVIGSIRWMGHRAKARETQLRQMVEQRTHDLRRQTDRLMQSDQEKSSLLAQLREQSEAFERQAREDALTGIDNRRSMDERLARAFELSERLARPLAFALLDLDYFKHINDEHSHAAGDAVLRGVAQLMRAQLRPDDCVARWGGEEFALLFPDTDLATAQAVCERVRAAIEDMDCSAFAPGARLSASIGVAEREGTGHPDRLASRADQKLYAAKAAGRNRVVV